VSSACSEEGRLDEDEVLVDEMEEMELVRRDRVGAMKSQR